MTPSLIGVTDYTKENPVYRHIPETKIAMMPEHGYLNNGNHSQHSIRWLDYLSQSGSGFIQHARNSTGEVRKVGVPVDGFCRQTNTIYQYHVK